MGTRCVACPFCGATCTCLRCSLWLEELGFPDVVLGLLLGIVAWHEWDIYGGEGSCGGAKFTACLAEGKSGQAAGSTFTGVGIAFGSLPSMAAGPGHPQREEEERKERLRRDKSERHGGYANGMAWQDKTWID